MLVSREPGHVTHGPYWFLLAASVMAGAVLYVFARAIDRHPDRQKPLLASGVVAMVVGLGGVAVLFSRI